MRKKLNLMSAPIGEDNGALMCHNAQKHQNNVENEKMIVCNKCGGVIPEAAEEPKDAAKEPSGKYGNKKYQEEAPARRASLLTLPCKREVNGFESKDVDLCDVCKAFLLKHINELQFRFINSLGEFEVPEMPGENQKGENAENEACI